METLYRTIYTLLLTLLLALGLNTTAWADWQTQKLSPTESIKFPDVPEKSPNNNWNYTQAATAEQPGMSMYVTILPLPWWMRAMISITGENAFTDNENFHESMIDAMKKQSNKDGNGEFTDVISDNFELNGFHGVEIEALRTTSSGKTQQHLIHAMFLNGRIFLYGVSFAPQDPPPEDAIVFIESFKTTQIFKDDGSTAVQKNQKLGLLVLVILGLIFVIFIALVIAFIFLIRYILRRKRQAAR